MQFRNDIQGLRALAFLLVFIFHLNSDWLPGGFLGVDLFFVISGYLITTITLSDFARGKFSFVKFFIRRIKRIVPAYMVLLLAVAAVGLSVYLYTDMPSLRTTVLRSAFFVSNLLFAKGNSYFGASLSENPLLHTWSLAIEMQFYLILPFILWFFRNKLRIVLPIIIIATTAFSTYNLYVLENKSAMYFSLIARIPEFLVGAYFSVVFKAGLNINRRLNNVFAVTSLTVLMFCAFSINEESNFPGYLALIPCIASGILLVLRNNAVSEFFSNKIPVYIGEMSYSLYLWHWPILAFLRYTNDTYMLNVQEILFVITLTFILSWLSYTFVEKKFRKQSTKAAFILLSSGGLALGSVYFVMPVIAERNKIPDQYARPVFGLKSHDEGKIEKFGDLSKNDSIILIGDSHALMLKPFLDKIGTEKKFSFYTLTTNSYPALRGIKRSEVPDNNINYYYESLKSIPKTDSLIKANKIIILTIARVDKLPSMKTTILNLAENLDRDQKLILLATFPTVTINPLKKKTTIFRTKDYHNRIVFRPKDQKILMEIASSHPNVYYYDVSKSKVFKDAPYMNDTVAYYNAEHINHFGSLKLADDIGQDFYAYLRNINR
ncbi:acyltransferase family protein [Chryseobacterium koreense]